MKTFNQFITEKAEKIMVVLGFARPPYKGKDIGEIRAIVSPSLSEVERFLKNKSKRDGLRFYAHEKRKRWVAWPSGDSLHWGVRRGEELSGFEMQWSTEGWINIDEKTNIWTITIIDADPASAKRNVKDLAKNHKFFKDVLGLKGVKIDGTGEDELF